MSYKTILVHADHGPNAAARYALACLLAASQEAHLVAAALTGLNLDYYRDAIAYGGMLSPQDVQAIHSHSREALAEFTAQAQRAGVSHEVRMSDDDTESGLVLQARYADLVVLGQCEPALLRRLPEYMALHGGRPLLLVPHSGQVAHIDQHALVAWDGSRAAARAVTDALPLLRRSRRVTVAVFNPEQQYGVHGEQPGADIALFLARHQLKVEVLQQATSAGQEVGDALLSLAAGLQADLLVMGAYGHLRWREIVLGGVTRHVLQSMTLPVFMAH